MGEMANGTDMAIFDGLVDDDRRRVSLRTCVDEAVYQLELDRIFRRAWLFLGHESEIPEPGNFIARSMGEDPVILTRDGEGEVHVLLNVCRHRGAKVCRVDQGSTRNFECPYHGWTYGIGGQLVGVPVQQAMYDERFERQEYGLREARVEIHKGLIFATWDRDRPPLDDFLGGWGRLLDMMYKRTDAGIEVVGPPQRWVIRCNWKLPSEQFSGDAYHVGSAHRSLYDVGFGPSVRQYNDHPTWDVFARFAKDYDEVVARDGRLYPPGLDATLFEQVKRNLDPDQVELLRVGLGPGAHMVFPNFAALYIPQPSLDGKLSASMTFRTFNPRGVDLMEITSWTLAERDAPAEVKQAIQRTTAQNLGAGGVIEQDDSEMWVSIQQNLRGAAAASEFMDYSSSKTGTDKQGWSDDRQWDFWQRWLGYMTGGARGVHPAEGYAVIDRPAGTGIRVYVSDRAEGDGVEPAASVSRSA
ncbi:MAG TPA: aromatic ring-hydroxylating dioxygenase subunit alpha [Acidimicrobiales bacterium]|nr:aromatic ring-hydroxylating dioxygenase subunit alpha [Acidimicrobiales bacterium]